MLEKQLDDVSDNLDDEIKIEELLLTYLQKEEKGEEINFMYLFIAITNSFNHLEFELSTNQSFNENNIVHKAMELELILYKNLYFESRHEKHALETENKHLQFKIIRGEDQIQVLEDHFVLLHESKDSVGNTLWETAAQLSAAKQNELKLK